METQRQEGTNAAVGTPEGATGREAEEERQQDGRREASRQLLEGRKRAAAERRHRGHLSGSRETQMKRKIIPNPLHLDCFAKSQS